jgi:competence protein ComEA
MSPRLRGALSRAAARVIGSRFAKPVARVAVVAAGLVGLAAIGHAAAGGASGARAGSIGMGGSAMAAAETAAAAPSVPVSAAPIGSSPITATPASAAHGAASPDDPVILNVAQVDDLKRLPGIGPKRADAILALRARMGRLHAVEDLLKVKGIGRATLKRLRPLIRLEPTAPAPSRGPVKTDGGSLVPLTQPP